MHIENALCLRRENQVSVAHIALWARLILSLLGPYEIEEERQEEIAEWLWILGYDIPATEKE
jgi:hypothetical protein